MNMLTKKMAKTMTAMALVMLLGTPAPAQAEDDYIGPPGMEEEAAGDVRPDMPPPGEIDFDKLKDMTPEEREAHRAAMREKFENMTDEERAAHRQKMREKFESMSPEEREAMKQKRREHFESLPPEEQERIRAMRDKHKQGRKGGGMRMISPEDMDAMKDMSPEERKAYMEQKREAFKNMSEEERAAHREEMKARFESMSDEEREALKQKRHDFIANLPEDERRALMKKHGGKHGGKWGQRQDGDNNRPDGPPPPRGE